MAGDEEPSKKPLNLRAWEKVDLWVSLIMPLHVWMTIMIVPTVTTSYAYLDVPNEMVAHYLFTINTNVTERLAGKNVICNPHFETFKQNYITNETIAFTKVRSDEYLALPEVAQHVNDVYAINNRSKSIIYVNNGGFCEVTPVSLDRLGCISFADVEKNCLGGNCIDPDTGVNYCWWSQHTFLFMILLTGVFTYVFGAMQFWSLMYDPPPACCHNLIRPWLAGICLGISAICFWVANYIELSTVQKNGYREVFYREFPGYYASTDNAWANSLFAASVQTLTCILFFIVSGCTPKYPRQQRRWKIRANNFNKSLRHIREKAVAQMA